MSIAIRYNFTTRSTSHNLSFPLGRIHTIRHNEGYDFIIFDYNGIIIGQSQNGIMELNDTLTQYNNVIIEFAVPVSTFTLNYNMLYMDF